MRIVKIIAALLLFAGVAFAFWQPRGNKVMGSYETSLEGRTPGQRLNSLKSLAALDGVVIAPGKIFSFNKTVGSWSPDRGYVRAPVSYDGELLVDWGGGVCQTSSTLYNAALLAGLTVVERHRHAWAPTYIALGRDAAVAQTSIDLRIRNPYRHPVKIRTQIIGNSIISIAIVGTQRGTQAQITAKIQARTDPIEIVRIDENLPAGQRKLLTRGCPGTRVAVYRILLSGKNAGQQELISQDSYPAMNRVLLIGKKE